MKKVFFLTLMACSFAISAWSQNLAKIGDTEYATVKEAIAAVPDGVETQIDLIADVVERFITIPAGKIIILNLNGKAMTSDYTDGGVAFDENATICNRGTLRIISNGTSIVTFPVSAGDSGFPVANFGNLTIDGGIYIGRVCCADEGLPMAVPVIWGGASTSNITINGGTFIAGNAFVCVLGLIGTGGGSLVINGGRFSKNQINSGDKISSYINSDKYKVQTGIAFHNSFAPWATTVACVTPKDAATIEDITSIATDQTETAVTVEENAQLTVEEGKTLTITGDLTLTDATSKLVIEKGARVIVGEQVTAASTDNIELTMDVKGKSYSNLLVAGSTETHPQATVALNARCKKIEEEGKEDRFVWQRFAVPSYVDFDRTSLVNATGYQTAICGWNYTNDCWEILPDDAVLEPFQCYEMTINTTNDDAKYLFPCALVGSGNPDLTLRAGWNYFANAYTAPLNLKAWLIDLMENFSGTVHSTVYVQNPKSNSWYDVTYADAKGGLLSASRAELQPMQAFIYYGMQNTTIPLKYAEYVYNPIVNPGATLAPARVRTEEEYKMAQIVIEDENGEEGFLVLYEGDQFSPAFDNGYDAIKMMNDDVFNMYFVTPVGDLSRLASNDIDSAEITLKTDDVTEFTMTFSNVTLNGYAILDKETNIKIQIEEGKQYAFSGAANQTYNSRFIVVKSSVEPTAVENTTTTQKANGIYTLTGQYVGRNLNILPAGVYVVNGQKVVR